MQQLQNQAQITESLELGANSRHFLQVKDKSLAVTHVEFNAFLFQTADNDLEVLLFFLTAYILVSELPTFIYLRLQMLRGLLGVSNIFNFYIRFFFCFIKCRKSMANLCYCVQRFLKIIFSRMGCRECTVKESILQLHFIFHSTNMHHQDFYCKQRTYLQCSQLLEKVKTKLNPNHTGGQYKGVMCILSLHHLL